MNMQRRHPNILIRSTYYLAVLLLVTFSGVPMALAEDTPPVDNSSTTTQTQQPTTETTTTATVPADTTTQTSSEPAPTTSTTSSEPAPTPTTSTTGPTKPTGADSTTYTYNETTGLWENDKYTWDPVTHQTTPKTAPTYSFNPETGMWDTTEWIFNAPTGTYIPNVISAAVPPNDAVTVDSSGEPLSVADSKSLSSTAPHAAFGTASTQSTTSNNTNDNTDTTKSSGFFDKFYNALISNDISSKALSGDALVSMNTLAGNALSGDASAIATIFNLLQSTWNLGLTGGLFSTFTQNIFGNIIGDLWLQPASGVPTATTAAEGDITVNSSQNTGIANQITLEATSGDSTVSTNTTAGDATTGSATVIANIINAINSSIASGSSFLGMLNIYGSLDGDILLPPELISTLLAANAIGQLDTSNISNANVIGDFTNNLSTTNNVTAGATSGDAGVTQNTSAGNATTGEAQTNVTVLNLTGRQVIGKNALLVFVNVLGTWVGMIVDAPTGSTSAALGGGITSDSTLAVTEQNNQAIVNDINAQARSGDALVTKNTKAGDATSGDAYAAVNILNMNSSQFALSDWFGVLFINVFGSWNGSFGIDTIAGSLPPAAVAAVQAASTGSMPSTSAPKLTPEKVRAYAFTPHSDGSYTLEKSDQGVAALAAAKVLSSDTGDQTETQTASASTEQTSNPLQTERDWTLTLITTALGVSLLGAERIASRRSNR